MIRLIAAIDDRRGIAKNGNMPWRIPEDEAYFSRQTKAFGGRVLTGARTFRESYKGRPLAGRHNYILTHDIAPIPNVTLVHNLKQFLEDFSNKDLWVAGGAEVFAQIMAMGKADELYLTHIDADFGCDQFFPAYQDSFVLTEQSKLHEQNGFNFNYAKYVKTSHYY